METEQDLDETNFEVRWENGKSVSIVAAIGEVDLATVADFKAVLIEAAGADEAMIIDLSRTTYMDSSGFSTLLEVNRVLRPMGLPMYLVGANANLSRMVEITRLDTIFSVGETVDSVLRTLDSATELIAA